MHAKVTSTWIRSFPLSLVLTVTPCATRLPRFPLVVPICLSFTTPAGGHRRSALLSPSERALKDERRTRKRCSSLPLHPNPPRPVLAPERDNETLVVQLQPSPPNRSHHYGLPLASLLAPSGLRVVQAFAPALARRSHEAKAAVLFRPRCSSVDMGTESSAPTEVWQPLLPRGRNVRRGRRHANAVKPSQVAESAVSSRFTTSHIPGPKRSRRRSPSPSVRCQDPSGSSTPGRFRTRQQLGRLYCPSTLGARRAVASNRPRAVNPLQRVLLASFRPRCDGFRGRGDQSENVDALPGRATLAAVAAADPPCIL